MRIDNFISDLGIIKRRTIAKELAEGGHIKINGQRVKPGHKVKVGDMIEITGKSQLVIKVLKVSEGKSISKEARPDYFEVLSKSGPAEFDL